MKKYIFYIFCGMTGFSGFSSGIYGNPLDNIADQEEQKTQEGREKSIEPWMQALEKVDMKAMADFLREGNRWRGRVPPEAGAFGKRLADALKGKDGFIETVADTFERDEKWLTDQSRVSILQQAVNRMPAFLERHRFNSFSTNIDPFIHLAGNDIFSELPLDTQIAKECKENFFENVCKRTPLSSALKENILAICSKNMEEKRLRECVDDIVSLFEEDMGNTEEKILTGLIVLKKILIQDFQDKILDFYKGIIGILMNQNELSPFQQEMWNVFFDDISKLSQEKILTPLFHHVYAQPWKETNQVTIGKILTKIDRPNLEEATYAQVVHIISKPVRWDGTEYFVENPGEELPNNALNDGVIEKKDMKDLFFVLGRYLKNTHKNDTYTVCKKIFSSFSAESCIDTLKDLSSRAHTDIPILLISSFLRYGQLNEGQLEHFLKDINENNHYIFCDTSDVLQAVFYQHSFSKKMWDKLNIRKSLVTVFQDVRHDKRELKNKIFNMFSEDILLGSIETMNYALNNNGDILSGDIIKIFAFHSAFEGLSYVTKGQLTENGKKLYESLVDNLGTRACDSIFYDNAPQIFSKFQEELGQGNLSKTIDFFEEWNRKAQRIHGKCTEREALLEDMKKVRDSIKDE